jgi:hypothetical protein
LDLFIYASTQAEANNKIRDIYETVKENLKTSPEIIRTKHAVTIINQYPHRHVQIVLRLYRSPAEVLMGFDIDW